MLFLHRKIGATLFVGTWCHLLTELLTGRPTLCLD